MNTHHTLPIHPLRDEETQPGREADGLEVCGLVEQPLRLSAAEFAALPHARLSERFVCEEGWAVERLMWEGVPLRVVLSRSAPLPAARYVRVCAGVYWLALPLNDLDHAMLCDRLNDAPLSHEHGAPWRLVLSSGACFTSVKWVRTLELTAEPGAETAEQIARNRLAVDTRDPEALAKDSGL